MSKTEALLEGLPMDVERFILELTGSMEHSDKMKILKDSIYFHGTCNYLYNLPPFEWFDYITFEEAIDYINIFTICKCCSEHQKRRPTTQMFIEGFVPEYPTKHFQNDKKCKCKCRHLSRNLCREINDIEDDFDNLV